jgi:hypothetical protein
MEISHSKRLGGIGVAFATQVFLTHNFNVFKDETDLSRIDLIIEKNCILKKIQVKTSESYDEFTSSTKFSLKKSGPNGYVHLYTPDEIDYFFLYDYVQNDYCIVKCSDYKNGTQITIRNNKTKNNQTSNIKYWNNMEKIEIILRDYTPNIHSVMDDDIVQTTTLSNGLGNQE